MAAAAPLRKLLLRVRLGHPPRLPIPPLSRLPPQIQQPRTPAPPPPTQTPAPNLRDLLFSPFHPAFQIHPSLPAVKAHPSLDPRGDAEAREDADGKGAEVWADSVKKKRKRKMNKHKLRKLRRRLRRQT